MSRRATLTPSSIVSTESEFLTTQVCQHLSLLKLPVICLAAVGIYRLLRRKAYNVILLCKVADSF